MMYPDDLAYLVFAMQDARDHGRIAGIEFYQLPPFIFDYLMTARLLYTLTALVWIVCSLYVVRAWLARRHSWVACSVAIVFLLGLEYGAASTAYQSWMHPVEWMTQQFIRFN